MVKMAGRMGDFETMRRASRSFGVKARFQHLTSCKRLNVANRISISALVIMHELTARPVSSLAASGQMNLSGVREWTCRERSDHWQAGLGSSRTSYITDERYLRLWRGLAHCMLAYQAVLPFPKNNVPERQLWPDCFWIHALP